MSLLDPEFMRLLRRLQMRVDGRVRSQDRGERRSKVRGAGGDFVDTRPYAAGDDLRHLDWHLYARLDQLLVRLYETPRDHALHLLLDVSGSMSMPGKAQYAAQLTAALGWLALCSGDRTSVATFSDRVHKRVGPLRGKKVAPRLLQFLEQAAAQNSGGTDLLASAAEFTGVRRRGTAVIVSDFLAPDGRVEALRRLASARMRVAVLHVLTPEERDPTVGEDLTLIDSETREQMTVQVTSRLRDAYRARLAAFTTQLSDTCRSYGFAFVEVSTDRPLEDLLLGELRSKGLVG
jgi:uncharacterized protein (DUF58 family)